MLVFNLPVSAGLFDRVTGDSGLLRLRRELSGFFERYQCAGARAPKAADGQAQFYKELDFWTLNKSAPVSWYR
jgi:hypothetical protein